MKKSSYGKKNIAKNKSHMNIIICYLLINVRGMSWYLNPEIYCEKQGNNDDTLAKCCTVWQYATYENLKLWKMCMINSKINQLLSQMNCTMTPLFKSTRLMHHKEGFHAGSCLYIDVHKLYFGTKWHPSLWSLAALTTTCQVLIWYLDLHVSDQPLQ